MVERRWEERDRSAGPALMALDAARPTCGKHVNRLPVLDAQSKVVGVIGLWILSRLWSMRASDGIQEELTVSDESRPPRFGDGTCRAPNGNSEACPHCGRASQFGETSESLVQLVRRPIEESALPTALAELATHLRDLSELMRRHIAGNSGGLFGRGGGPVPRLAGDADAIERQHPDLLRDVAALLTFQRRRRRRSISGSRSVARSRSSPASCWPMRRRRAESSSRASMKTPRYSTWKRIASVRRGDWRCASNPHHRIKKTKEPL